MTKKTITALKGMFFISILLSFSSCSRQNEQGRSVSFAPKVIASKGYIIPKDSVTPPKVIIAGKSAIIKAGIPKIVLTNTNIHSVGKPKVVSTGTPGVFTPGTDTFFVPKTIPAVDRSFVAGIPEVVVAKDAYTKDQNPENFSSFSKLQGLKHEVIGCMFQDKRGNLWFGTDGGGVSKYDGKSFTHFTEKEGLSSNTLRGILEDKRGNLWFGTYGGVSKYDGKSFTVFTETEGLSNNTVLSMLEDKRGNIWFGTRGGGVSKYDGNRVEAIQKGDKEAQRTQYDLKRENGKLVKSFTHLTKKEGLSNNTVWSILEDKSGNIWFGTDGGGVSKYDGISFTHFTEKEGLSNNIVLSILEDKSGNLWFGTYGGGVSKYDGSSFTHFTEKEGLSGNIIGRILEDKSGNIWFSAYGGGVTKYVGNQVEEIEGSGKDIQQAQDLKRENGKLVKSFTHFTEKEGLSNNTVLSMLEDKSGNLWFGTDGGGVAKYAGKSFTHFTEKEGLNSSIIWSILEDKRGNLWIGTDGGGVSKYAEKSFTHYTEKEGLNSNIVRCILEDKRGNLWFGTYGEGVSKYDGKSFTHYTEKEGLSNNIVLSMLEDKSGNLWFSTHGGGVSKYDGNRVEAIERGDIEAQKIQQGLKKENGKFVKSFTHFTKKEGLSSNIVRSIFEDKSGNIWFGTDGGGVSKYDGEIFTHFTEKEGLSNNTVRSILEDESGNLWFGTYGGGISKYDGKFFTHFTEKEGLSSNTILSMLKDKSGNLWFGTRFGLSKLSEKNRKDLVSFSDNAKSAQQAEGKVFFKNYTYEDGFLGIGVNGGKNICEDQNGTIWIGANDRLTAFHPKGDDSDTSAPNIQLTSIELFNENVAWINLEHKKDTSIVLGNGVAVGDFEFDGVTNWYSLPENVSLAYNNNYLTFNFIGITQKQSKKVKYQYTLEGMDDSWSAITNRTEAPYGNLPQGKYKFKVKAMNSEGYWSNEFDYSFSIRPPWWKTWWMYLIYVVSALVLIGAFIKWRERNLEKEKVILEEKVELRTKQLDERNTIVEEQKKEVEEKKKEITDSINYALRIQQAILPDRKEIYSILPQSFIVYKPKDIVSGDFYFFLKKEKSVVIASADCTGHGVPGALMSMVGSERLTDAVQQSNTTSEILPLLNKGMKKSLKQSDSDESTRDGMDIALCSVDNEKRIVTYVGANRPIWIIRNGQTEVEEIKATKKAIGGLTENDQHFDTHELKLNEGDTFYLSTDGYADTFSGASNKKLTTKKFKQILVDIQHKTMQEQAQHLDDFIEDWKAGTEQIDDILVIGIRM
ncbi:MAG: two-component regulator propeller domain-containing protein [Bacteroidota bacterium]